MERYIPTKEETENYFKVKKYFQEEDVIGEINEINLTIIERMENKKLYQVEDTELVENLLADAIKSNHFTCKDREIITYEDLQNMVEKYDDDLSDDSNWNEILNNVLKNFEIKR